MTPRHCLVCGARLRATREQRFRRWRCPRCGFTFYDNPVPATVALVVGPRGVLLCRRAADPFAGTWDLAGGFLELGLAVSGGAPGPHLANIVTVGELSADHYATGSERYNRLYEHLSANRVKLSIRRGTLRFSLHVYNTLDDVERVLNLARQFLAR